MSDGTQINAGSTGDVVFTEDLTSDPSVPVGAGRQVIQGFKEYVGEHGVLGAPVSPTNPKPVFDREAVGLLEQLCEDFSDIKWLLEGDSLRDLLEGRGDYVLVRDDAGIAFGMNAAQDGLVRTAAGPTIPGGTGGLIVIAKRSSDGHSDRTILNVYTDSNSSIETVEWGFTECDIAFKGHGAYGGFAAWPSGGTPVFYVTNNDGSPLPLWFGDGSAGSAIFRVGVVGVPVTADPPGSLASRRDGVAGNTLYYRTSTPAWVAVA